MRLIRCILAIPVYAISWLFSKLGRDILVIGGMIDGSVKEIEEALASTKKDR